MGAGSGEWGEVQARLLAGDRLAVLEVNRLVTATLTRLRAYDFRDEWDDLRQEVLLSVVANARAGRLRDPRAFVAYVQAITRNKLMDRLSARVRRRERLAWDEATSGPVADPAAGVDEASLDLWSAVGDLPEEQRRAIFAVYREGRSYQEASGETGIPLGTLKRRLRDGLEALRQRLAGGAAGDRSGGGGPADFS